MKVKEIPSVGIAGISVEFNHSELVVLKDLRMRMTEAAKETQSSESVMNESSRLAVQQVSQLLNKVIPDNVMSLDEANEALFADEHQEASERY